jgi:hypothetical protein
VADPKISRKGGALSREGDPPLKNSKNFTKFRYFVSATI